MKLTFSDLGKFLETLCVAAIGGMATLAAGYGVIKGSTCVYNALNPESPTTCEDVWQHLLQGGVTMFSCMHFVGHGSRD